MKIGILSDNYFPIQGGAEVYAYNLAVYLRSQGHDVTFFTF
jgi:hypothetical protein